MTYETGRPTDADPSNVESRDDFGDFVLGVLADYRSTGASEWENGTLEDFLDGLSAFALACVVGKQDQEQPTWRLFAEMIATATGYE